MFQGLTEKIRKSKKYSTEEKKIRVENLNLFLKQGFPNKKLEDWKFTDLNKIISENFKKIEKITQTDKKVKVSKIKDFQHNSLITLNGNLQSSNFKHENIKKIKVIKSKNKLNLSLEKSNSLIYLNNALFDGGYSLQVSNGYKFNKPLIIYNYFSHNIKNKIINSKNSIILKENSQLELIDLSYDNLKNNFIINNLTDINIGENSHLIRYVIQSSKSNGLSYKYTKSSLAYNSNYEKFIFSSGTKFSKIEETIDLDGEKANCNILSGLCLNSGSQHEIKTKLNHLKPNCTSYQKIKKVLGKNAKGTFQGKIFVKSLAQKTDAYQLSRGLLLDNSSEFNAKPELEIYADDVKCSHGSTSGYIDDEQVYYLMTRGIDKENAVKLLTKAFLNEVTIKIPNSEIKDFIKKNLDRQLNEH